jgi:hypothetical protein
MEKLRGQIAKLMADETEMRKKLDEDLMALDLQ